MEQDNSHLAFEILGHEAGVRIHWRRDGRAQSYAETLQAWRDDPHSVLPLAAALASMPFKSFYWECPVLAHSTAAQPFECVVLKALSLHRYAPDREAFADRFADAPPGAGVVHFANLGGGSVLVAPLPVAGRSGYGHLAEFLRLAPSDQICAFFACLSACALNAMDSRPTWISTAGDGVAWLHGRIDPYPKYYRFAPYMSSGLSNGSC